jgi:CBS domain-containing protein
MKTQTPVSLENVLPTLSTSAMQAFCQDMDGMLGIPMSCAPSGAVVAHLEELKSSFAKCAAVYSIQSSGILDKCFWLMLDRAGLFVLSGLVVMLPQDTIKQQSKQGTLDNALKLMDTVKEIGNLLVGSWDRIFREQLIGHKHLLQSGTQIADPWANPKDIYGIDASAPCLGIVWEITVQEYPPFKCAVVFGDLKAGPAEPAPQPTPSAEEKTPAPQPEQKKTAEPASVKSKPAPAEPEPAQPASPPVSDPTPAPTAAQPAPAPAAQTPDPSPTGSTGSEPVNPSSHPVYDAIVQMTRSGCSSLSADPQILSRPAKFVMQNRLLWLSPNDPVETALQRMQQNGTRYALVEEQGRLAGILSRGDLNAAVSPYLKSPFEAYRRPLDEASLQIRVKWFMSRLVHVADPDMPLWKIMETMYRHEIRALPVQNAGGVVLGLVTVPDIFRILLGAEMNVPSSVGPQSAQPAPEQQVQPAQEEK